MDSRIESLKRERDSKRVRAAIAAILRDLPSERWIAENITPPQGRPSQYGARLYRAYVVTREAG